MNPRPATEFTVACVAPGRYSYRGRLPGLPLSQFKEGANKNNFSDPMKSNSKLVSEALPFNRIASRANLPRAWGFEFDEVRALLVTLVPVGRMWSRGRAMAGLLILVVAAPGLVMGADGDQNWDDQFFLTSRNVVSTAGIHAFLDLNDGRLLVGGDIVNVGDVAGTTGIAVWDGQRWSGLGGGLASGQVFAIARQGNDVFVGGNFTSIGGTAATNLARWDGSIWHPVGGGVTGGSVRALESYNGQLAVGGNFNRAGGLSVGFLALWNGSSWSSVGGNFIGAVASEVNPPVRTLAKFGGNLCVGGRFAGVGGVSASNLAVWNGAQWSAVGPSISGGPNGDVWALAAGTGDELYVGGAFSKIGETAVSMVAKWDSSGWSSLGGGLGPAGRVSALKIFSGEVYAGGTFTTADGKPASGLASWDGQSWHVEQLDNQPNVRAIGEHGGHLFVSTPLAVPVATWLWGMFAQADGKWKLIGHGVTGDRGSYVQAIAASPYAVAVGGVFLCSAPAEFVAEWSGTSWNRMGPIFTGAFPDYRAIANGLAFAHGKTYMAGNLLNSGPVRLNGVGAWNGSNWMALGEGLNETSFAVMPRGRELFVGHNSGISVWNGTHWSRPGLGLNGRVWTLAMSGPDVIAGGEFTNSGPVQVNRIARWDGTNWWPLAKGIDGPVFAVSSQDGLVYAGGRFSKAGDVQSASIAAWDGTRWNSLGAGVAATGQPGEVYALSTGSDGTLYAGGHFQAAGEGSASFIAQWDGAAWSPLGTGVNGNVRALDAFEDFVYVGGEFSRAGATASSRFGRWQRVNQDWIVRQTAPESAPIGTTVAYQIEVQNKKNTDPATCTVEFQIPEGTLLVGYSSGAAINGRILAWNLGAVPAGGKTNFSVDVSAAGVQPVLVSDRCMVKSSTGYDFRARPLVTSLVRYSQLPNPIVLEPVDGAVFPHLSDVAFAIDPGAESLRQVDVFIGTKLAGTAFPPAYTLTLTNLRAGLYNAVIVSSDHFGTTGATNVSFRVDLPANDDFEKRLELIGTHVSAFGSTWDATTQPGEPKHDGFWTVNSIWWKWTATYTGQLTINTLGSDFSHVLAVYRGSALSNLTAVGVNKLGLGPTACGMNIDVEAGVTYSIAVDGGYPFDAGMVQLNLNMPPGPFVEILFPASGASMVGPTQFMARVLATGLSDQAAVRQVELYLNSARVGLDTTSPYEFAVPVIAGGDFQLNAAATSMDGAIGHSAPVNISVSLGNNQFNQRIRISGYSFDGFGTTVGADFEPGEPRVAPSGRNSVWWEWLAPANGTVTIVAESSEYSSGLEVYLGSSVSSLTLVAADINDFFRNEVSFSTVRGRRYAICVNGFEFAAGTAAGRYRLTGKMQGLGDFQVRQLYSTNGVMALEMGGIPGMRYAIEASSDLLNWSPLGTNTLIATNGLYLDAESSGFTERFYRARAVP